MQQTADYFVLELCQPGSTDNIFCMACFGVILTFCGAEAPNALAWCMPITQYRPHIAQRILADAQFKHATEYDPYYTILSGDSGDPACGCFGYIYAPCCFVGQDAAAAKLHEEGFRIPLDDIRTLAGGKKVLGEELYVHDPATSVDGVTFFEAK